VPVSGWLDRNGAQRDGREPFESATSLGIVVAIVPIDRTGISLVLYQPSLMLLLWMTTTMMMMMMTMTDPP
jgi:hypothetical protein